MESGDTKHWKNKYFEQAEVYERKARHLDIAIRQLRHGMSKLSVAADGIDHKLDGLLAELRKHIRDGADNDAIKKQVSSITKRLLELDEAKNEKRHAMMEQVEKVLGGLRAINLSSEASSQYKTLNQLVSKKDAEKKVDQIIRDSFQLLGAVIEENHQQAHQPPARKNRLLGKLFTRNCEEVPQDALKALDDLLNRLAVPEEFQSQANNIKERISDRLPLDQLCSVIESIIKLITNALSHDQRSFEQFFEQITERLSDMEDFLSRSYKTNQGIMEGNNTLNSDLKSEINQLETDLKSADSIQSCMTMINEKMNKILVRVDSYSKNQSEQLAQSFQQIEKLESKLKVSEISAQELMQTLAKQRNILNRDPLTGLQNRQGYNTRMEKELKRMQAGKKPFTLVVIDLDHFKAINDNYGHLAGDKVLAKIGKILLGLTRSSDFAARFGGEEFVLICHDERIEAVVNHAESIRKKVEEYNFHFRGTPVTVTASFGVYQLDKNDNLESAFAKADNALYQAKRQGRNQVIVYTPGG